jgi:hypothetical protein
LGVDCAHLLDENSSRLSGDFDLVSDLASFEDADEV